MTNDELQNITVEPQEQSAVKITGELPYEHLEAHREAAVKHLGKDMKVDGFRHGHVPEKVVVERAGEMALLGEMAERAMATAYPKIIEHHNIDAIGYPEIQITKIAKDNPLGFTATVAVMPEITLPDYKAIAKEVNLTRESDDVTDEEVDAQIKEIFRQKAAYERLQKSAATNTEKKDSDVADLPTPESVGEEKDEEFVMPELTDELIKTLGQPGQFENVADFKAKIREHLETQKKQESVSKHRAKITDAIAEQTDVTLPNVMVDAELNQMFAQMEEDMKRAQVSMDDYLAHVNKTKEDLRNEWQPLAEKRAKLQLALNKIADAENIEPDAGEVDHQVSHLLEHHKDADEKRVRTYVTSVLRNEKVMQMLEGF